MATLPPPFDLEGLKILTAQKILTWSDATLIQAVDGLTGLYVIDSATEEYITSVQRQLDTVRNDYRQKAIHFAASKLSLQLLANILHVGADPDVISWDGNTVAQRCSQNGCAVVAESMSACRPDLTIVKNCGVLQAGLVLTDQLQYALWYHNHEREGVVDVAEIWRKVMSHGFPSLAQLAYEKKWWAVHNLCRRRVISNEEKNKKYKGKTAVEWAQVHGQDMVVKEMTYLLELDDNGGKDEGQGSDEVTEIREMLLLTITKGNEEKEELLQEVAVLKTKNDHMKKEMDTLKKSVESLSVELKEMKKLKTENEDMKKEMNTLKKSMDPLTAEMQEMKTKNGDMKKEMDTLKKSVHSLTAELRRTKKSCSGDGGNGGAMVSLAQAGSISTSTVPVEHLWGFFDGEDSGSMQKLPSVVVSLKVQDILEQLRPDNAEEMAEQMKKVEIEGLADLLHIVDMVFEKACDEPGFATACAQMCRKLSTSMRVQTEDGQEVYFIKALLMKCQREFEAERLYDENRDEKLIEIEKAETDEKRKELQLDLENKDRKMKRRHLGMNRFIGELFMMSMLSVKIMHQCVARLLSGWRKRKHEDSLECLCELLNTIGAKINDPSRFAGAKDAFVIRLIPADHQEKMNDYFNQMQAIVDTKDISSRVRFMLLDTIDLRNEWVSRRDAASPKTMDLSNLQDRCWFE